MRRLTRAVRAVGILAALGLLVIAVVTLVTRDDDPTSGPPEDVTPGRDEPLDDDQRLEDIDADGPVRIRWETETERGPQDDLVVVVGDGFEARLEGLLSRYRVGDERVFCFPDSDGIDCDTDPNSSSLVPTAGKTTFALDEAEFRVIAGREAWCWAVEVETTSTLTCADRATGVSILAETIDSESGSIFRQTLVEWGPPSAADLELPSEVSALVG